MFKKIMSIIICVSFLSILPGCGNNKVIDGHEYETYGLLNEDSTKNSNIKYDIIWGNIIWGVILIETIVAPIYFFGFSLFEPTGKVNPSLPKGALN